MDYYNAVLKRYNSGDQTNLRFMYYHNLQSKKLLTDKLPLKITDHKTKTPEDQEFDPSLGTTTKRDLKQESIARSKRVVKELVRNSWNLNFKFLTLTYSTIVNEREHVFKDVKSMCYRYKKHYNKTLKYIASIEWQKKRACLHVHLIVDSHFIPSYVWSSMLWGKGFIKINSLTKGKSKSSCLNAVNYILKYIQKDALSCDYYRHLYFRSKNWNMKVDKQYYVDADESVAHRYANFELGNGKYVVSRFDCISWNDEHLVIIDFYPLGLGGGGGGGG